jgi:hypothetical protein
LLMFLIVGFSKNFKSESLKALIEKFTYFCEFPGAKANI